MTSYNTFEIWVEEALRHHGGKGTILQVAKYIWTTYERELRKDEDTFYKWQYKMRWAAKILRDKKIILPVKDSPKGIWVLK